MVTTVRSEGGVHARSFTGAALREIAFPLGGIGTGTVSLGGRGDLRDWEIFNRPAKGRNLPFSFFALRCESQGDEPIVRVLERRLLPPFVSARGLPPSNVAGLPRLAKATFTGSYPIAEIVFHDGQIPLQIELEAYSPFTPFDDRLSGMPVAVFLWRLTNPTSKVVNATLAYSQLNPIGYDAVEPLRGGRNNPIFGGNLNEWVDGAIRGFRMSRPGSDAQHPGAGTLAVVTPWPDVTFAEHWERSGWFDDLQNFWDGFRATGRFANRSDPTPTPQGQTDVSSLGLLARIEPGQVVELPVVLAWRFPNLVNYWNTGTEIVGGANVVGSRMTNWYATQWRDAWAAAREAVERHDEHRRITRKFRDELFESTLPSEVIDAVSSQMSILRTTTCLRIEDGRFFAFEGCNDDAGCCPMNCTHVWNYEHTLAFLFPGLERTMRLTDYEVNTLDDGEQKFRTILPLEPPAVWNYVAAADGQMGTIIKLFREWQISGDDAFLRRLWPAAKRALHFAWNFWDPDRDGVMEGEQHNTYDIDFYGPNSMCGVLYLGALRAAEEMARHVGDPDAADYRHIYESGRDRLDRELWNGEYYEQRVRMPAPREIQKGKYPPRHPPGVREGEAEPRYQYGRGCLSDQLLGQWLAHVTGLGYLLPEVHVRSAVRAIHRHNFRHSILDHESCQRAYAINDEPALLLCSWPNGGRPHYPFPYADEAWTGTEYAAASLLIYEGELDAGLEIVRGVRSRHDGVKRNPWDEFECGHHYARALASWALLLALQGYRYSAPRAHLRFAPRVAPNRFRCLFSAGGAWGRVEINAESATLTVFGGELTLRTLEIGDRTHTFDPPATISAGAPLQVNLSRV